MEGDLQVRLGERLRQHRTALGISQERFAEQLGFHRTYLGDLERGKRNPTLQTLERLASQLDADPVDLLRHDRPDG